MCVGIKEKNRTKSTKINKKLLYISHRKLSFIFVLSHLQSYISVSLIPIWSKRHRINMHPLKVCWKHILAAVCLHNNFLFWTILSHSLGNGFSDSYQWALQILFQSWENEVFLTLIGTNSWINFINPWPFSAQNGLNFAWSNVFSFVSEKLHQIFNFAKKNCLNLHYCFTWTKWVDPDGLQVALWLW